MYRPVWSSGASFDASFDASFGASFGYAMNESCSGLPLCFGESRHVGAIKRIPSVLFSGPFTILAVPPQSR